MENGKETVAPAEAELSPEEPLTEPVPAPAEEGGPLDGGQEAVALLRQEVAELRQRLEGLTPAPEVLREPVLDSQFRALYPEVAPEEVPDAVYSMIREGVPPAAAYALWEKQESVRLAAARSANRKNAGGWGAAQGGEEGFFSPEEVRAMSREQVRENYGRILASMKHWT